eukprot:3009812-Amphidinium_carterae.1
MRVDAPGVDVPERQGHPVLPQHSPNAEPNNVPPPTSNSDIRVERLEASVARLMQMMELMVHNKSAAPTQIDSTSVANS